MTNQRRMEDPSGVGMLLAAAFVCIVASASFAADVVDFYQAVPGETTEGELVNLEKWGQPLRVTLQSEGVRSLSYRIGRWNPVTVTVIDGMVTSIDAAPPANKVSPAKMCELLKLSPTRPVQRLPQAVRFAPPVASDLTMLHCTENLALLFTSTSQGRTFVQMLRLYAELPPMPAFLGLGTRRVVDHSSPWIGTKPFVLVVGQVMKDLPAARAGLKPGDVLTSFNGKALSDPKDLKELVEALPVPSQPILRGEREGKPFEVVVSATRKPLYLAYYELAVRQDEEKLLEQSAANYTRTIKLEHGTEAAYARRAQVYQQLGDDAGALSDLQEAIRLAPDNAYYRFLRGRYFASRREFGSALDDFNSALHLQPLYSDVYRNRAAVHQQRGDKSHAAADRETAQILESRRPSTTGADPYIQGLRATATGVKFYENERKSIPIGRRSYQRQFSQSTTRAIFWELTLNRASPGQPQSYEINAVWYQPDGAVLSRQVQRAHIEPDWQVVIVDGGYGYEQPGNWTSGTYRIEFFIEKRCIALASFEISKTGVASSPRFPVPPAPKPQFRNE